MQTRIIAQTSIATMKRRHENFFSPATLRFFGSVCYDTLWVGHYFVTSEQYGPQSPRVYNVRQETFNPETGKFRIRTVGGTEGRYNTHLAAKKAAIRLAKEFVKDHPAQEFLSVASEEAYRQLTNQQETDHV